MFDAIQFLKDHNIPYFTEGKNCQDGWTNVQCPFCQDHSNHLGINHSVDNGYGHCHICGHKFLDSIIINLINCTKREAKQIIKDYNINYMKEALNKKRKKATAKKLELPKGTSDITERHRRYLVKRNFDPYEIIRHWGIKGTNHIGSYKFRIIAPIMLDGRLVSYQGRDITNKQALRYKACEIENEIIHHKHILYGMDNVKDKKGILVEGITDAWRFGKGAVATFGTTYTTEQVNFIIKRFEELYILFDSNDPLAIDKAEKLAYQLSGVSLKVEIIELDYNDDPGSLPQKEAMYIKKELLNY
jgi:hypothetical protein